MPHVVGIDQSANHTGVCVRDTSGLLCEVLVIEPVKIKEEQRLAYVRDKLHAVLERYAIVIGVHESYSYNSINQKFLLGEIGGIVKLALYDYADKQYAIAPKQLKKFIAGRGAASKKSMMNSIEKQWQLVTKDDNIADAFGLSEIGLVLGGYIQPTKRYQLEVLKAINAPPKKLTKKVPKVSDSI